MPAILLSKSSLREPALIQQCGLSFDQLHESQQQAGLIPYHPYVIGTNPSKRDIGIARSLELSPNPHTLYDLTHLYGEDLTAAVADTVETLREQNAHSALMGAAVSTYAGRVGQFGQSVLNYQNALMDYRNTLKTDDVQSGDTAKKKKSVRNAFTTMQKGFQHELSSVTAKVRSRRGTPLTSATRGINIARSSRSPAKLNVTSTTQAHNLVKFSMMGKILGSGLVAIDFADRAGNVHLEYKAGGDWERELFIESTSFTFSVGMGSIAVRAGLSLLMVATPVGWVALIVGGAAIAGAAAVASVGIDEFTKNRAGDWYDSIMKSLGL